MALPTLTWRYLGSAATGGTISGTLDAIFGLASTSTFWTWSKDNSSGTTEAVYGAPTATNPLAMRYIIGGRTAATVLTVCAPDTSTTITNTLVCGMARSSGVYAGWTQPSPFSTPSSFSGYWLGAQSFATLAWSTVHMWDSQEGCIIQVLSPTAPNPGSTIAMGALFDPLVYNRGVTCESDDRLYFMSGGGASAAFSPVGAAWLSAQAASGSMLGASSNTAGASHGGFFVPGTNTVTQSNRIMDMSLGASFVNLAGNAAVQPIYVRWSTGWFAGQSRQFGAVKDTLTARTWTNGGTTVGYTIGYSANTAGDTAALLY